MGLGAVAGREGWLRVIGLAIAAVVGLRAVGGSAVAAPQRFTFEVAGLADRAYGPVGARLAPGERIGVLIPGRAEADDQVRWFTAQYALAPAIVIPIRWAACGKSLEDPACAVKTVDRVLVAGVPAESVAPLGDALGLSALERVGQVVVYARRER
jgi:hypothetical protein